MPSSNLTSTENQLVQWKEANCPYPDCTGLITGPGHCVTCKRILVPCPSGHVMAEELGFCDTCGFDAKKDSVAEPIVAGKFVLPLDGLLEVIADAYREAALANNNMRNATELLETIRGTLVDEPDYHKVWDKLDEQVGKAFDKRLREVVICLRRNYVQRITEGEIARLQTAFRSDEKIAWAEWLRSYSEAVVNWRMDLAKTISEASYALPQFAVPVVKNIRRSTQIVIQERWPEALALYCYLAKQEVIPELHRARLMVVAGEIELYQLKRTERAKEWLDKATVLAPDDERIIFGQGEYCAQTSQLDEALKLADRVVEMVPNSSQGYVLRGDCLELQSNYGKAAEAYETAIRVAPGETASYSRLLRLYGRPEMFSSHENRLLPLRETSIAIEPLNEYSLGIDLGSAYQQNGRYEEAYQYYDKAIALDVTRPGGYVSKGYAYLEQELPDQARAMFDKATEVAPTAADGYWGRYYLFDQLKDLPHAAEAFECGMARQPGLFAPLHDFELVEEPSPPDADKLKDLLIEALTREPENSALLNPLLTLADLYSKTNETVPAALSLYRRIREAKGTSYEAEYQNIVGNISFYWQDYAGAAEAYKAAIKAAPSTAVYYSNLSLAYRNESEWDKAREALDGLSKVEPDRSKYLDQVATVWNLEGNSYFAQSKFDEAIKCYEQAIANFPNEAVYHSNLSLAWENLKPAKPDSLKNALDALKEASRLNPGEQEYTHRLEGLTSRGRLSATHGNNIAQKAPLMTPLAMEVAKDLVPFVEGNQAELSEEVTRLVEKLRDQVWQTYGVRMPGVRFRGNETDLPQGSYLIMVMEVPIVMGTIATDKRLFTDKAEKLTELGVSFESALNPLDGSEAYWVNEKDCDKIKESGLEVWSLMEYPIRNLEAVIRVNLSEFVDHQEVTNLLTSSSSPLLAEISASAEQLTALVIVLRALVSELVPIIPFENICKTFSESFAKGTDLATIVEQIRSMPEVRSKLPGNSSTFSLYKFGNRFSEQFAGAVLSEQNHKILAMTPDDCQASLAAVREKIQGATSPRTSVGLLVERPEFRPLVRRLTELEFPYAPVLSRAELLPDLSNRIIGEIELD